MTPRELAVSKDSGESFATIITAEELTAQSLSSVFVDHKRIYLVTDLGLFLSTDKGKSFANAYTFPERMQPTHALFAKGDYIYIGTNEGLLISTDRGRSFQQHTMHHGLGADHINSLYFHDDVLYVSTSGGGLSVSPNKGRSFRTITTAQGLSSNWILHVCVHEKALYVATTGGLSVAPLTAVLASLSKVAK